MLGVQARIQNSDEHLHLLPRNIVESMDHVGSFKTINIKKAQQISHNSVHLNKTIDNLNLTDFWINITRYHMMLYYFCIYHWMKNSLSSRLDGLISTLVHGNALADDYNGMNISKKIFV